MQHVAELKGDLSQYFLFGKMIDFLDRLGESFPEATSQGLCHAYVMMRIRARAIGEEKKHLDRLRLISKYGSDGTLKEMSEFFKNYKLLYTQSEAELAEKRRGASDKEKIRIKEEHRHNIMRQVATVKGRIDLKRLDLVKQAEDIYYFIHSMIAAFNPDMVFHYRVPMDDSVEEKKELASSEGSPKKIDDQKKYRSVGQSELLDAFELLRPEEKLPKGKPLPIRKALSFSFTFTENELVDFFAHDKNIQDGDMIRIGSTNHAMFITKEGNKYILDDPNSQTGPLEIEIDPKEKNGKYLACQKLAAAVKNYFFSSFGFDDKLLPISLDIYESTEKSNSPRFTPEELLDSILQKRGTRTKINDVAWDGTTPLILAITDNNIPLVKALLLRGAHPNISDDVKATPMYHAASFGNVEIVKILAAALKEKKLESKMNVRRMDSGATPILTAAGWGYPEVLAELAKHVPPSEFTIKTKNSESVFHCAAQMGAGKETIEELLKHMDKKAIPGELIHKDTAHKTPAYHAAENGHGETLTALLIARVANKNLNYEHDLCWATSPLVIAAKNNHPSIVRVILEHDPDQFKKESQVAGEVAAEKKNSAAMKSLLECGAGFKFIKKDPDLAIRVLLGIKNDKNFQPVDPAKGLHPMVIRHIRKQRKKLHKAYINYLKSLKNPFEQRNQINAILNKQNVLGVLFTEEPPQPRFSVFKSPQRSYKGAPVTEDIYQIINPFTRILDEKVEQKQVVTKLL